MNNLFYDGFNSKLIETAFFEGFFEIPILEAPKEIVIPSVAVPFSKRDKYYLEAGLEAMLIELTPQDVIVYGSYNPKIFGKYERYTRFHHLPDWTTYVHKWKKVV